MFKTPTSDHDKLNKLKPSDQFVIKVKRKQCAK